MNQPSISTSHAPELRRRSDHLVDLAARLERTLVMGLPDELGAAATDDLRLLHRLLERNLHQLHRSADELRSTAQRFRARADELEANGVAA